MGGDKPAVYKLEELKELVAFADARGVTLVPELEMPGHSGQLRGTLPVAMITRPADNSASFITRVSAELTDVRALHQARRTRRRPMAVRR